jgi:hypothetical protein
LQHEFISSAPGVESLLPLISAAKEIQAEQMRLMEASPNDHFGEQEWLQNLQQQRDPSKAKKSAADNDKDPSTELSILNSQRLLTE